MLDYDYVIYFIFQIINLIWVNTINKSSDLDDGIDNIEFFLVIIFGWFGTMYLFICYFRRKS